MGASNSKAVTSQTASSIVRRFKAHAAGSGERAMMFAYRFGCDQNMRHYAGSKFVLLDATGHYPDLSAPDETIAAISAYV